MARVSRGVRWEGEFTRRSGPGRRVRGRRGDAGPCHTLGAGLNGAGQATGQAALTATVPGKCPPKHRPCPVYLEHAFTYSAGTLTDLGSLGGITSAGAAINTAGTVVGYSTLASGAEHAFADHGGVLTDLGAYNVDAVAEAINDAGLIVGQTYGVDATGSPFHHAFIYRNGAFQDLNTLIPTGSGWQLTNATAINDNGQILVDATNATGLSHAFLLTPAT